MSRPELPPPVMQGEYLGACVVCRRGKDVRVAFEGHPDFLVATMEALGVSNAESRSRFEQHQRDNGWNGGEVGGLRVCENCTTRAAAAEAVPTV